MITPVTKFSEIIIARIEIVALRRNGISSDPLAEAELNTGDILVVQSHPNDLQATEIEIMAGF